MIALIYRNTSASCVAIAQWYEGVSHDQFTRLLAKKCCWPTLLWQYFSRSMIGEQGYLVIDDTVVEKYGRKIFGVDWVYSSALGKAIRGINIVMMVWTDGERRIPIGIKVWRKGKSSKMVLASKLLRWAKRLELSPEYVLFDSWYSAKPLLKQIESYGWHYITRIKKNRNFNAKALRQYWPHRYGHGIGYLTGNLKVLVVKDGSRYLATNHLSLSIQQVKSFYTLRQQIEEVFKILKNQLAWGKSPAYTRSSQIAHLHLSLMAFCVLQHQVTISNTTPYEFRRCLFRQAIPSHPHLFQPFMKAA